MSELAARRGIDPPKFTVRDPINALTHFIGFIGAICATAPLLIYSAFKGAGQGALISLGIFMLSMVMLYGASTAYHSFDLSEAGNRFLKKLDHTMIFFLIAGSYTPVCMVSLAGSTGTRLLILVWSLAVAGGIFKLCWVTCPRWLSSVIYIAMGWSCVIAMPRIVATLSTAGFLWLLAGGLLYTVGGVVYALKRKQEKKGLWGCHEVFHLFVMGGSICHYVFMLCFLL